MNRTDYSTDASFDIIHSRFVARNSSVSRDEMASFFHMTKQEASDARDSLRKNGYIWHLHQAANIFQQLGSINHKNSGNLQPAGPQMAKLRSYQGTPRLVSAVWTHEDAPHIELVHDPFKTACLKIICAAMVGSAAKKYVIKPLQAALAGMSADAICEDDAIISIFTDATTEGAGVIASPLEIGICAGAKWAANGAKKALTAALNSELVSSAISYGLGIAAATIGCPAP